MNSTAMPDIWEFMRYRPKLLHLEGHSTPLM